MGDVKKEIVLVSRVPVPESNQPLNHPVIIEIVHIHKFGDFRNQLFSLQLRIENFNQLADDCFTPLFLPKFPFKAFFPTGIKINQRSFIQITLITAKFAFNHWFAHGFDMTVNSELLAIDFECCK